MNIELLYAVADKLTTGYELMDSRWQNCEAEVIAAQAISSCRFNHREHGDAFTWYGTGLKQVSGGGLGNNPVGLQKLINDDCVIVKSYAGELTPPSDVALDDNGLPLILRVTDRLLHYAMGHVKEESYDSTT